MSSSARLNRLVNDAYINDDVNSVYDAFFEYQQVNCSDPQLVSISDAHTQTKRKILVNCGKCWHCRQTKINDWTTRMYAHCEDYKFVYFITLTYASFYSSDSPVTKLLMRKLGDAVWVRDNNNFNHRLCYNPCLLVKKHYQDFLKRLRKNTGNNTITYVISGEYGHDYGRPHFHMILFSNEPISRDDIKKAWSVSLVRNSVNGRDVWSYRKAHKFGVFYDVPIGRIDYNDLVTNGTFNTTAKVRVDGRYMNAGNCFSYVAKYVTKADKVNFSRVNLAYKNLYYKQSFVKIFDNEVVADKVHEYLLNVGYSDIQSKNLLNSQKLISYEKPIFKVSSKVFSPDLSQYYTKKVYGYDCRFEFYPSLYFDFRDSFRPFCEFSRGTPIGSIYAKRNIHEFTQDVFSKPLLQTDGFVVPSYFRRKAKEFLYPLRASRSSRSGISFCLDGLPNLYGRLSQRDKDSRYHLDAQSYKNFGLTDEQTLRYPKSVFKDAYSGERIIFKDGLAKFYKYSRTSRSFINSKCIPVPAFIRKCCDYIVDEIERHNNLVNLSRANLSAIERSNLIALDMGLDPVSLADNYQSRFTAWLNDHQKLYHEIHSSVE